MLNKFGWQNGYAVFSVDGYGVDVVKEYISGQEEHHRWKSFQEELREVLIAHGIQIDERYLWD